MDGQDIKPVAAVRKLYDDTAVKAAGAHECRVQNIGAVRCRHHDHLFVRLKTIHLDQNLVEGLFALVVAPADPRATHAADRVYLVNENNRGSRALGGQKQIPNAGCTHPDKHLNKFRSGD